MAAPLTSSMIARLMALGDALVETKTPANIQNQAISKINDQIITYTNEGVSNSSSVFKNINSFESDLLRAGTDSREHSIKDFLERPIPLWNGDWSTSDAQFKNLITAEFPDAILGSGMYKEKLSGFLGLRADLKIRLQVNSQPFQAGRLRLYWVPYYKYLGKRNQIFDDSSEASMISRSTLPGVELDISSCTECEFQIPYASPQLYYNLSTGEGYWGKLYLAVYSPLVDSTGSGKVDCNIWFSFSNVQLGFPTGAPLANSSLTPSAQVGKEEKDMELNRSFSTASAKFASALRSIPPIPFLDSIIQPAAWASDTASEVLKLFGLSKPESTNIPNFVKSNPLQFMPNSDGVNLSHNLSLLAGNSIELMPDMTSCGVDEMSLLHLASTPSYFRHFAWSSTDAAGTKLMSFDVQPLAATASYGTAGIVPSMLSYVTSSFAFWRGSIDLTFKFVKTKFHSGRVRLYFQPGDISFSTNKKNFNYSQVIDIRSEDIVKFRIPYVSTKAWMMTDSSFINAGGYPFNTGVVQMEVLNELMATSTVSKSIDVLVEISAGPDFELAGPRSPLYTPYTQLPAPPPSGIQKLLQSTVASNTTRDIRAQIGGEESREDEQDGVVNKDQLGSKRNTCDWINVLAMHGEKATSVRQLIKRSSRVAEFTLDADGTAILNPFSFGINYARLDSASPTKISTQNYLSHFLNLYTFWRGSVNFKIIPRNMINYKVKATVKFNCSNDPDAHAYPSLPAVVNTKVSLPQVASGGPEQIIISDLEGCIDITCPYYSQFHMTPVTDLQFKDGSVQMGIFPPYVVQLDNIPKGTYDVYRCATDAFQMGYVLGPPLCEASQ